jgi:hypothetical protein
VWFNDPATGEPTLYGTTDPAGVFSARVPDGSPVTAAALQPDSDPPSWQLFSVLATHPGDDLELGDRPREADIPLDAGTVTATVAGAFPGATRYGASVGCISTTADDAGQLLVLPIDPTCLGAGPVVSVVARASDEAGKPLAFSLLLDQPTPQKGDTSTVTMGPWREDFSTFTAALTNLPASAASARTQLTAVRGRVRFEEGVETSSAPTGAVTHALRYEPGLAERLVWQSTVALGTSMERDGAVFFVRSAGSSPFAEGDTIDVSGEGLAPISGGTGAIGTGGSPVVSWTVDGDTSNADGVVVSTQWANPNGSKVRWTVLAPAGETTITFPTMPVPMKKARGVNAVPVTASIYLVEADHIEGWDDFRRGAGLQLFDNVAPATDLRLRVSATGKLGL